ncbi:lipase 1-like [Scaptodrosophila lebanonensis]|uniref:Lipase 1-like n=1 Tax=Drosophila lebanonensis TaxID=7225 RepID=A0A6J2T8I8_DROLE|nr:lipase 1-like [Scaptodrosophila lebanonensis]
MDRSLVPIIAETHPAGISTRQIKHYIQLHISGKFRRYDFHKRNWEMYGQREPPEYNLLNVNPKAAVNLYYSSNDGLANEKDVLLLDKSLPNSKVFHVDKKDFSHTDFIFAKNLKELIHKKILSISNEHEKKNKN